MKFETFLDKYWAVFVSHICEFYPLEEELISKYHYELALNNFYSAIQMHNEGKEYKQNLNNMFFLQDDFNDNLYHFCAANERYRINNGVVRKKIKWLKDQVGSSRFYQYQYYIKENYSGNFNDSDY